MIANAPRFGVMSSDKTREAQELQPLPLGDITPLLQWFTETEVKELLGSQMTQSEVNMFVMACRRSTPRAIEHFKAYLWRSYYAIRNV